MARQSRAALKPKTRDRVLEAALALFNARGVAAVTTAEIADAVGINEGNLYYYFRKKAQLAIALFDLFEARLQQAAAHPVGDIDGLASLEAYQRGWFNVMWEFRFFYRDGGALRQIAPGLRARVQGVTLTGQDSVRRVFRLMRLHGLMRATDEEIEALIANVWIVSSYWMDFRHGEGAHVTQADLEWGLRQVEMLYRPYLR